MIAALSRARQLVAIDESERLVCFGVYPLNTRAVLVLAFDDYNGKLAQALGIELYRRQSNGHDVYELAMLVAETCYDDGAAALSA